MRWPRIAVVIATYGKTDTLRLAIASALRQRYPDFRILVIIDGNPDQLAILRALDDDRITLHDLVRNSGEQSGPNNIGVALSDADLIAFLNHDDLWFPDHLTILTETLLMRHADIAFSQAAGVFPREAVAAAEDCRFYLVSRLPGGRYRPHYSFVGLTNVLVRKATFDALGGFRPARECLLESSQDFLIRASRAGARFAYADQLTTFALHAGIRAGSYLPGHDTTEHALLAARLAAQDVGELRALVLRRLIPDGRHRLADTFVRLTGFPLRLARPSLHGWRRGHLINRLRATRGLSPLPRPSTSVADFLNRRSAEHLTWITPDEVLDWHGQAIVPLLGEGWHEPEGWGCWAVSRTATLRFGIRGAAGTQVELGVDGLLAPGVFQCITLRTRSAVVRRWRRLGRETSRLDLMLRHRTVARDEVVTVTLSSLTRYGPTHRDSPHDGRRLAIAVVGVRLRFLPDTLSESPQ